eukprot:GHRR01025060.1.p1 GENE.GHRR01025060.1~~GHRR01025060.1.p1  ORF type:complete len:148 (+),score=25.40 GHRR01025060.1:327-770(+)
MPVEHRDASNAVISGQLHNAMSLCPLCSVCNPFGLQAHSRHIPLTEQPAQGKDACTWQVSQQIGLLQVLCMHKCGMPARITKMLHTSYAAARPWLHLQQQIHAISCTLKQCVNPPGRSGGHSSSVMRLFLPVTSVRGPLGSARFCFV